MTDAVQFFEAIHAGKLGAVTALLDADPGLITATENRLGGPLSADEEGMTALHAAVAANQLQIARILIERGVDPNVRNGGGRLALHDAFEYGREMIAQLLISSGAEVDAAAAAALGRLEDLNARLVANKEEANDLTTGLTPLGWAAYGQSLEAAQMLIAAGAKVTGDPYDELAWGPAADVAAFKVAAAMLAAGADANYRDPSGNTAAHLAILSPLVADPSYFIAVLRNGGLDVSAKNAAGRTALDEAHLQSANPRKDLSRTIEVLKA